MNMVSSIEQNLDLGFKSVNLALKGIDVTIDVMNNILEYFSPADPTVNLLRKYIKAGGELETVSCKKGYEEELHEMLKDAGVNTLRTANTSYGGSQLFIYPSYQHNLVEDTLKEFRAEHGHSGIVDHQILSAYAEGRVRELSNLDRYEATLCAEHAEKRGLKVVIMEPVKGCFTVSYAERDADAFNRIKADVAIELSGLAGKALKKQLDYENEKVLSMIDLAKNYDKKESLYFVDLKGRTMEIDWDGISIEGEREFITLERTDLDFNEKVESMILEMNGPVMLTKEQKEALDQTADKKSFLVKVEHENNRPVYTEEERNAIREMSLKKELYELKLASLEPDQAVYDICLENDDMRLATFEEFNDVNEVESANGIDEELFDEIQNKYHFFKANDAENVLDYELVDFEEAILDGREIDNREVEEFERDAFDLMHDKNNNLMPDEFEPDFRE